MTSQNYHVYLLRDPRIADRRNSIFYVGKGTGQRSRQHELEAARANILAEEESLQRTKKLQILAELAQAGLSPQIDFLAPSVTEGVTEAQAFLMEATLIAALEMKEAGNLVSGQKIRMIPADAKAFASTVDDVQLPEDAPLVIVPVSGIWGGANLLGNLWGSGEAEVWENARQLWSTIGQGMVHEISRRAGTDRPVALLAVDSHPEGGRRSVVVGVFELARAFESSDTKGGYEHKDGHWVQERPGWGFERVETDKESAHVGALRELLLGHSPLTDQGRHLEKPQDRRYYGV